MIESQSRSKKERDVSCISEYNRSIHLREFVEIGFPKKYAKIFENYPGKISVFSKVEGRNLSKLIYQRFW